MSTTPLYFTHCVNIMHIYQISSIRKTCKIIAKSEKLIGFYFLGNYQKSLPINVNKKAKADKNLPLPVNIKPQ
jgi:hypothetical protein